MNYIKSSQETIKDFSETAEKIRNWSSKSSFRFLFTFVIISLILTSAQILYILKIIDDADKKRQERYQVSQILQKELLYKKIIDSMKTCIETQGLKNNSMYCSIALEIYKKMPEINLIDLENLVEKKAYFGMLDIAKDRLRVLEGEKYSISYTQEEIILDYLSSFKYFPYAFTLLNLASMISIFIYLKRNNGKSISNNNIKYSVTKYTLNLKESKPPQNIKTDKS